MTNKLQNTVSVRIPKSFKAGFDYKLPENIAVDKGALVKVPFGPKQKVGVVWGKADGDFPEADLKEVAEVLTMPSFKKPYLDWLDWVADYTMGNKSQITAMCLSVPAVFEAPKRKTTPLVYAEFKPERMKEIALSDAQAEAVELWKEHYEDDHFFVQLIDGVTGSGKTETYMAMIEEVLAEGKQAVVMLPEIVLTQQILKRFADRFGFPPTPWHSGLTPKQRREHWKAIQDGRAKLVIGARSALFLPYDDVGIMVIDEEHDASFKQEDGVMYHARDMAVARGKFEQFPIVLASATPSLETIVNVKQGKYLHSLLPDRFAGAAMPKVSTIDLREAKLPANHFISPMLQAAVEERLKKNEQTLLFLNRRGYAPLTICQSCGHKFECKQCSAWVVHHKTLPRLQCHHCGYTTYIPDTCPECEAKDSLVVCGPGAERLEEEAKTLFPNANMLVMTSDTMQSPKLMREAIEAIEKGEVNIIIGTQMLAKGHHFPNLTLVGVIDADLGLEGGDLRAAERTFQLLHQVAGRAGRAEKKGEVLMQTFQPDHAVMRALVKYDQTGLLREEEQIRKLRGMPPFGRLAGIIISGKRDEQVHELANKMLKVAPNAKDVLVLGPAPAPMFKLRNNYRYRFLVKTAKDIRIQNYIDDWLKQVHIPSSLQVSVDIDPYSFF